MYSIIRQDKPSLPGDGRSTFAYLCGPLLSFMQARPTTVWAAVWSVIVLVKILADRCHSGCQRGEVASAQNLRELIRAIEIYTYIFGGGGRLFWTGR